MIRSTSSLEQASARAGRARLRHTLRTACWGLVLLAPLLAQAQVRWDGFRGTSYAPGPLITPN